MNRELMSETDVVWLVEELRRIGVVFVSNLLEKINQENGKNKSKIK